MEVYLKYLKYEQWFLYEVDWQLRIKTSLCKLCIEIWIQLLHKWSRLINILFFLEAAHSGRPQLSTWASELLIDCLLNTYRILCWMVFTVLLNTDWLVTETLQNSFISLHSRNIHLKTSVFRCLIIHSAL